MLEGAWSLVRAVAPQLAMALNKMITTVTPLTSKSQAIPVTPEGSENVPGAVAIPLAGPDATAVALIEHVALSVVAAAHRAFGPADAHSPADSTARAPSAPADTYPVAPASLRWIQAADDLVSELTTVGSRLDSNTLDGISAHRYATTDGRSSAGVCSTT